MTAIAIAIPMFEVNSDAYGIPVCLPGSIGGWMLIGIGMFFPFGRPILGAIIGLMIQRAFLVAGFLNYIFVCPAIG